MNDDQLLARLTAVEDRLAITELEADYARTFDSRDGDAWAALFTPDGVYRARGASPTSGSSYVAGRPQLAAFCTEAPFDGLHLLHLPQLTLSGDTATGRVHLEFLGAYHDGRPAVRMSGYYDVRYVRDDGRWYIADRVTTTVMRETRMGPSYPPTPGFDES